MWTDGVLACKLVSSMNYGFVASRQGRLLKPTMMGCEARISRGGQPMAPQRVRQVETQTQSLLFDFFGA